MTLQEDLATEPSCSPPTTMTVSTDYSRSTLEPGSNLRPGSTYDTANSSAETPASQMVTRKRRTVLMLHVDIISDSFWEDHSEILGVENSWFWEKQYTTFSFSKSLSILYSTMQSLLVFVYGLLCMYVMTDLIKEWFKAFELYHSQYLPTEVNSGWAVCRITG